MSVLEFYFPRVYGTESSVQIDNIRKLCCDLVDDYQEKMIADKKNEESFQQLDSSQCEGDELFDYDLFVRLERGKTTCSKSELDHYLEEEVLPRTSNFDILLWWKINGVKYPTLQAIARDILAIPVSTVASESAFSTGGRLISKHPSRLHLGTVEVLMCCQSWLWSTESQDGQEMNCDGLATINDDMDDDGDVKINNTT